MDFHEDWLTTKRILCRSWTTNLKQNFGARMKGIMHDHAEWHDRNLKFTNGVKNKSTNKKRKKSRVPYHGNLMKIVTVLLNHKALFCYDKISLQLYKYCHQ